MSSLLKRLLNVMEMKVMLYKKFISLLQEEWNSITEYSIETLESIIQKKDDLVNQLQTLESERAQIMKKVAQKLKVSHGNLTMKNLLKIQKSSINSKLAQSRKNLLAQLQTVNKLNYSVRDLMDRSSLSFRKSLVHLHSEGETSSSPYHANGQVGKSKIYSRMLSVDA